MANLTIKNIPQNVYDALKTRAALNHRSINSEVIVSLEQVLQNYDTHIILKDARKLREKTKKYVISEKMLTAEKNKGRE